ncbi:MAG: LPS assembly lipoprotein LptE [Proteobacteria bacterium]|nr:LPS assembly lipoprotein LptE [Pseudomonadota bacterium]
MMKATIYQKIIGLAVFCFLLLCSCGYQLVKDKGIYGGDITSLYVPVFKNKTYEPHASLYVTDSFTREIVLSGLFKVNTQNPDGYIEGNITEIKIIPATMNVYGVVVEKTIIANIDIALFRKNGGLLRKWSFSDSETYNVVDINAEDFNKRDALKRLSGRIARKFCSIILIDY